MAARPVSRAARSQRAVRAVATVLRFSARLDSMALRLSASDAVPWPDVVAAEPHGVPVQRAVPSPGAALDAPLPEGAPWQAVVRGGPWREVAQDGPLRAVPLVAPLEQLARPSYPGHTRRWSPRSRRRQVEMLQSDRQVEA